VDIYVDIIVHVVGGSDQEPSGAVATGDNVWQHSLDMNLMSAVRLDRALLPAMLARGRGAIVHVTSVQRTTPLPTTVPYAAAKAALGNYSKNLANQVAPAGVRVNSVSPGFVETEAAAGMVRALAEANGTDEATSRQRIMDSVAASAGARARPDRRHRARPTRTRSPSWSVSWSRTTHPASSGPSTGSAAVPAPSEDL
ncbi:MAG TPA: SDR family NAD(P)-dependent oxidoreductase, partial [Pseudonocardia sp.]|nr:SDR family NAD(P)-dependent oxidoreductase [Pseudonocardia sp.]